MNFRQFEKLFSGTEDRVVKRFAGIAVNRDTFEADNTLIQGGLSSQTRRLSIGYQDKIDIRPAIQAEVVRETLNRINEFQQQYQDVTAQAEAAPGDKRKQEALNKFKKRAPLFDEYESVCRLALQEPEVRAAYQAAIGTNLFGEQGAARGERNAGLALSFESQSVAGAAVVKLAESIQTGDAAKPTLADVIEADMRQPLAVGDTAIGRLTGFLDQAEAARAHQTTRLTTAQTAATAASQAHTAGQTALVIASKIKTAADAAIAAVPAAPAPPAGGGAVTAVMVRDVVVAVANLPPAIQTAAQTAANAAGATPESVRDAVIARAKTFIKANAAGVPVSAAVSAIAAAVDTTVAPGAGQAARQTAIRDALADLITSIPNMPATVTAAIPAGAAGFGTQLEAAIRPLIAPLNQANTDAQAALTAEKAAVEAQYNHIAAFEKQFINQAIVQAQTSADQAIIDAVEPYRAKGFMREVRQALAGLGGNPQAAALQTKMNGLLAAGTSADKLGQTYRYLMQAEAIFKAADARQPQPANHGQLKELHDAMAPFRDELDGMQSQPVRAAVQSTKDIIALVEFAQNLKAQLQNHRGRRAQQIKNMVDGINHKLNGALAGDQADDADRLASINTELKDLLFELNEVARPRNASATVGFYLDTTASFKQTYQVRDIARKALAELHDIRYDSPAIATALEPAVAKNNTGELVRVLTDAVNDYNKWLAVANRHQTAQSKTFLQNIKTLAETSDLENINPPVAAITDSLGACGYDTTAPATPITDTPRADAMAKLLTDEIVRVVDHKKDGKYESLKGTYLEKLQEIRQLFEPAMSPEGRARAMAADIHHKLRLYTEGDGIGPKPAAYKIAWANHIRDMVDAAIAKLDNPTQPDYQGEQAIEEMAQQLSKHAHWLTLDKTKAVGTTGLRDKVEGLLDAHAGKMKPQTQALIEQRKEMSRKAYKHDARLSDAEYESMKTRRDKTTEVSVQELKSPRR